MASVAANMDSLLGQISNLDITDTTDHARPSPETKTSAQSTGQSIPLSGAAQAPEVADTSTLFNKDLLRQVVMPRYLFRTFYPGSSGKSDEKRVASQASLREADTYGRDLMSRDEFRAAKMLFKHLKWLRFSPDDTPDNLSSWTSSLLYAIQYAIYRCHKYQLNPIDIKILVVDITKFPPGQFAPATQIINKFKKCVPSDGDIGKFFSFRLDDERYNNGEYLSQGRVNLTGRSWIVSLDCLTQSGLSRLYPEFDDEEGKDKWANRVLELRRLWSPKEYTSEEDFRTALDIARGCFSADVATQMALMLLCFKDRIMKTQATEVSDSVYGSHYTQEPVEVGRYYKILGSTPRRLRLTLETMLGTAEKGVITIHTNSTWDVHDRGLAAVFSG